MTWRRREPWSAVGHVLVAAPVSIVVSVGTMFAVIYTAVLLPIGVGLLALPLLRGAVTRRVAAVSGAHGADDGGPATPDHPRPGEGRLRASIRWAFGARARREVAFLLADGPIAGVAALLVLGVFYLITRALLELSFVVVWPAALHGAWGGSVAGALLVHCAPGAVMLIVGPRVIGWAASLRPRAARALLGERRVGRTARVVRNLS